VESNPWDGHITRIITRDPHATCLGEASTFGGRTYSPKLRYWFNMQWTSCIHHDLTLMPGAPDFVHINSLEFILMLCQLVAAMDRFASLPAAVLPHLFPSGRVSDFPISLLLTDNMAAAKWASALSWMTENNQNLIAIYAQLLRQTAISINAEHIPGTAKCQCGLLITP
jgi:hypothetical protein